MDILFSAKGTVVGDAAASGIIHLHIVDVGDALEDVLPGSPTTPNDLDGDGNPDERHGDELGVTIFTKSGRCITHPIKFGDDPYPGTWQSGQSYAMGDVVSPVTYNGLIFEVAVAGTSGGGNEPQWNIAPGGRTRDNGVIWRSIKHDVWELALAGEVAK